MKLVLAIGAAIAVGILAVIIVILLLIPFGGMGAIGVIAGKAAGFTWNVFTITAAIVAVSLFLLPVVLCGVTGFCSRNCFLSGLFDLFFRQPLSSTGPRHVPAAPSSTLLVSADFANA